MSINSEFISADNACDLLATSEVESDQEHKAMRVRALRTREGAKVILVEGGAGEYLLMRL